LADLLTTSGFLDAVIVLTLFEGAALTLLHARTGRGIAAASLWPNLLAGLCLMLTVRAVLGGAWWGWVALALFGALVAHLTDLRSRWRS
jgi:hypothetical protein